MSYYMSHVEREILSALIDGELDSQERRLVHEHLQECAECRETLEEFTQVHGLVGELPRLVAPLEFLSDVLEPPRRRAPQKVTTIAFSGRRRWVSLGAAAAAIAITLAGLFVPEPSREPPVDAFIERHVSVHNGVEPGAQVLFGVGGR